MALRGFVLTLLCALLVSFGARAEDWTVQSLDGSARTFAHGEWGRLHLDDPLTPDILVATDDGGRLRLLRGADALAVAPATKIRMEREGALVRVFAGALGADASASGPIHVMTTYAAIETTNAGFGVVAQPYGAAIAVRRGVVSVTDLMTRATVLVKEGQILRIGRDLPDVPQNATGDEPAMAVAGFAAGNEAAVAKADMLDRRATGVIPAQASGNAGHGKADRFALAAAARTARALTRLQDDDVDVAPWDDSFQWTEIENGVVRLKPIWRVVLNLSGPESYEFWFLAFVICLFLGAGADAIMNRAAPGLVSSALLISLAFATSILVRDAFFRSGANVAIEPYLSLGMMLAAMTAALVSAAFAKLRLG